MGGGNAPPDERQWWAFDSDFDVAQFDKYEFGQRYGGPLAATVGQTSFTWRVALQSKAARNNYMRRDRTFIAVRDRVCICVQMVDGPVDQLAGVKWNAKVYKADGSLGLSCNSSLLSSVVAGSWMASSKDCHMGAGQDQLRPYLLGEEGSQFVRVRVEVGIPKKSFDPLAMLPLPPPRQDVNERLARWFRGGNGLVKVVSGDGTELQPYKDLLTEASDVFNAMFASDMKEARANCIHVDDLSGEALDELISYITFGSTRRSHIRTHLLKLLDAAQRYELPNLKDVCERAIVEKMLEKKLPADFLALLEAAGTYDLRVAGNVGLSRLVEGYQLLSAADQQRFDSAAFAHLRRRFMQLSCQANCAIKI